MASVYKQQASCAVSVKWHDTWFTYLLHFSLIVYIHAQTCQQEGPCTCRLNDDSVIDLNSLSGNGNPTFTGVSDEHHGEYSYNPCVDFTIPSTITDECTDVAICRKNTLNSSYTSLGNNRNVTFGFNDSLQLHLLYEANMNGICVEALVFLVCTSHTAASKLTAQFQSPTRYHLHLLSPAACPHRQTAGRVLSIGSVLCVIYFSSLLGYIGTGVLYRRVVHRSKGLELLPHRHFWAELPYLVRDGYLFFISPCIGNTVRYQAYGYEPL